MPLDIRSAIRTVQQGISLDATQAREFFTRVLREEISPVQTAALLTALSMKGETPDEIAAAATVLREHARGFTAPAGAIDTCGTGGDQSGSLNISTAVALVVAGAGVPVAKHGNRSVTSASGSTDVLAALGVRVEAAQSAMEQSLRDANIAFLQAPLYHPTMKAVAPIRAELSFRTIFNLLGPLTNPARVKFQLLGVYDARWLMPMAEVVRKLGTTRVWVVSGDGGLDEISLSGPTKCVEVKDGKLRRFTIKPETYGIAPAPKEALLGGNAPHNARKLRELLEGAPGAYRNAVLLNAAAALVIAGKARGIKAGIGLAAASIDSGKALQTLDSLVAITTRSGS